jgi:methyltransferase family protein
MRAVDVLLAKQPKFHGEGTLDFALTAGALKILDELLEGGETTLETGAGASTVLFAAKGCKHTAISLDAPRELPLIEAYCEEHGIDQSHVEVLEASSKDILPRLGEDLDLVLIDGSHAFPFPFLDWLYTAPHLRVGGKVLIDDTNLWTGRVLSNFLKAERGWELLHGERRFAVFEKTLPFEVREWPYQPYVYRRSRPRLRAIVLKWRGLMRRVRRQR